MNKREIQDLPKYFDKYINLVPDIDLDVCFQEFGMPYFEKEKNKLESLGQMIYAPNKWTVLDIFQHLIDTERIFAYRALRFARFDNTILPGYDEDAFAAEARASVRNLDDLLQEYQVVRQSSEILFRNFDKNSMMATGQVMNSDISVLAMGFTIVGHGIHHLNVIKERYYPLLEK